MSNGIETIGDARCTVDNSGVAEWDWGPAGDPDRDYEGSRRVLERLAQYLWRSRDGTLTDQLLARFVREELGQDPADYGF